MKDFKKWVKDHKKVIAEAAVIATATGLSCIIGIKYAEDKYLPSVNLFKKICSDLGYKSDAYALNVDNAIDFDSVIGIIGKDWEKKISETLNTDLYDTKMTIVFAK